MTSITLPGEVRHGSATLRPLCADDAVAYAAAFRDDPDLGRMLGIERDPDEDDVRTTAAQAAEKAADGRVVRLAIAGEDGGFAGEVVLHSFAPQHRRCEVGFWLVPAARGRGLGADALAATANWVFGELDYLRLEMTTTPDNPAVPALARRLGFTQEGVQRKRNVERGGRVDVVLFGLLREDWA
jgi:RimJ/RimL family protein N-acetyltransferase